MKYWWLKCLCKRDKKKDRREAKKEKRKNQDHTEKENKSQGMI